MSPDWRLVFHSMVKSRSILSVDLSPLRISSICLYSFMIEQFHQGRAFVLELIVVIILVIELVYFFRRQVNCVSRVAIQSWRNTYRLPMLSAVVAARARTARIVRPRTQIMPRENPTPAISIIPMAKRHRCRRALVGIMATRAYDPFMNGMLTLC
jgi:hypothetical protein